MHLLKLRALVVPISSSTFRAGAFPGGGRRTFKYLVQQSTIAESSRFAASGSATKDISSNKLQLFERTWTLSGSKPLEKLKLHLPGVTFISSEDFEQTDDDCMAKILVTSDSMETLEGMSVKSKFPYRTLLDFHPSPSTSRGNLVTEILLPRGVPGTNLGGLLHSLGVKGGGLVIVEDGVLASETIKLAATKGGRLAIRLAEDVDVRKIQVAVANRSKVYLQAPNVSVRDRIEIAGIGSSEVHLQSQIGLSTPLVKIAIAGSGRVRVQAASFAVDEMQSAIAGAGRIAIVGGEDTDSPVAVDTGGCNSHNVAIFGAGDVDCADVVTKRASVAVAGQGTLALEAQDALTLAAFGEAKLAYLLAPPRMVTLKNYHVSSPPTPMSEEDRSIRNQQKEVEAQELADFWRSLPARETALGVKN